ncbi:MAG: Hsp20/alpha crystallin family protein [Deltaproteobacteria bacterium]|nr:Hsp20/alpha crystallin family protein [Deltaproteobacteria bacterium]
MSDMSKDIQKQTASTVQETERTRTRKVYAPKVDIYETKEAIVMLADMPGIDEQSANVTLEKGVLTIEGTISPDVHKDRTIAYSECDWGDYHRAFTLSDEVNKDKIEASVKNGVLRLVLHKAEPPKAKKIEIRKE